MATVITSTLSETRINYEFPKSASATHDGAVFVSGNFCHAYESCGECGSLSTTCGWCDSIGACIALEDADYCSDSLVTSAVQCSWNTGWLITWWFLWGLSLFIFPLALYAILRCLCARQFSSSKRSRKAPKTTVKKPGSPKPMQQQVVLLSSSDIDHPRMEPKPIVHKTLLSPPAVSTVPVYVYQPQNSPYSSPLVAQPFQNPPPAPYASPPYTTQVRGLVCPAVNDPLPIALREPPSSRPFSPEEHELGGMRSSLSTTENFTCRTLGGEGYANETSAANQLQYRPFDHTYDLSPTRNLARKDPHETEIFSFERNTNEPARLPQIPELPKLNRGVTGPKQNVDGANDPAKLFLTPRVKDPTVEKLRQELDEQRHRNLVLEDRVAWLNRIKK